MAYVSILEVFMKITTNIDGTLLKTAIKETGARSQREVIENALRNLLADVNRKRFVKEFDSIGLNWSLRELKRFRSS